jgi:hypothetical protein
VVESTPFEEAGDVREEVHEEDTLAGSNGGGQ